VASIFISHSKRDEDIINLFSRAFAQTTMRAIFEEFENYVIPPWPKIRADVQQSSASFVLLSPNLNATEYTQNWVSFEVGLACAMNKPVWVYEQFNEPVQFPIPYLTDYVLYDPHLREHLTAIKNIVEVYDPSPSLIGLGFGALVGGLISGGLGVGVGAVTGAALFQRRREAFPIRCPHPNCGIRFNIYSVLAQLPCPACRQEFQINWPQAPQLPGTP
jgi:hypothetical protein